MQVDVRAADDFGYSSFSDTDTEGASAQAPQSKTDSAVERQQWNGASVPSGPLPNSYLLYLQV